MLSRTECSATRSTLLVHHIKTAMYLSGFVLSSDNAFIPWPFVNTIEEPQNLEHCQDAAQIHHHTPTKSSLCLHLRTQHSFSRIFCPTRCPLASTSRKVQHTRLHSNRHSTRGCLGQVEKRTTTSTAAWPARLSVPLFLRFKLQIHQSSTFTPSCRSLSFRSHSPA